jgi:hypothetical protein
MTRTPTFRSLRSNDRSRHLFNELARAQRRVLELELGLPSNPPPRGTSMLSRISER